MITRMSVRGLGSDPCAENFWSAACWLGSGAAQSVGVDAPAGTIAVSAPPVSNCAGVLNADGSCTAAVQPNDSGNSTDALSSTGGSFQSLYAKWVKDVTDSASTPAGSGVNWLLVGGVVLALIVGLTGGAAAGRHLR